MSQPEKQIKFGDPTLEFQVVGLKDPSPQKLVDFITSKSAPNDDDGGVWEFIGFVPVDGVVLLFKRPAKKVRPVVTIPAGLVQL